MLGGVEDDLFFTDYENEHSQQEWMHSEVAYKLKVDSTKCTPCKGNWRWTGAILKMNKEKYIGIHVVS